HNLGQYQLYLQQNNLPSLTLQDMPRALPLLNSLQNTAQAEQKHSGFERIINFYSHGPKETSLAIYQRALETILLPTLRNELEKYLQATDNKNADQIYAALKAYLMLKGQPTNNFSTAQCEFLIQTLQQIAPSFKSNFFTEKMKNHIQNALQLEHGTILDNKLIQEARRHLNSLTTTELAYLLLKESSDNNKEIEINLGTNIGTPPALVSKGTATLIPQMFTASAFSKNIQTGIKNAAEQAILGNEVIGKKLVQSDSLISADESISLLTQELHKAYIAHYVDVWESLVDNIHLNTPKGLAEADATILNLISEHSPLLQLLQTIHSHTNFEPILSNSFKLQALNTLFSQTQTRQKDSLYQIFIDLQELHKELMQPNQDVATSQQTIARIRSTTENYPEPIKNWLQGLANLTQNQLHADNDLSAMIAAPVQQLQLKKQSSLPISTTTTSPSLTIQQEEAPTKITTPVSLTEPELTLTHHKSLSNNYKKEIIKETRGTTDKDPGQKKLAITKKKDMIIIVEKS
ncbi:MAG TPA: ImcF-related family protein, partial [Gammaproteobacteria bacterium]|nr:ImcF-related family protein [Gammaproteobacteria bacterium]